MALGARSAMSMRLLVFAPTRRAPTETFVRANLQGLPFEIIAYETEHQQNRIGLQSAAEGSSDPKGLLFVFRVPPLPLEFCL